MVEMCYKDFDEYEIRENIYIDLDGKPVSKTKEECPYSYSPYVIWKNEYTQKQSCTVYSDRLIQWDYNKYNECCRNVWGNEEQYFDGRNPKDIEKFLSMYFNKEIKLTAIMEGCNVSNGYPYWIFFYENKN